MGGFSFETKSHKIYRLNPPQLIGLLEQSLLPSLPNLPLRDIEDKSKSDTFLKAWTCAQIAWFLIQLVARASQHLPITSLEIFTLAVVCCSFITYVGWWNKPQDVATALQIDLPSNYDTLEVNIVLAGGRKGFHHPGQRTTLMDPFKSRLSPAQFLCIYLIPCLVFGLCHLLAWNFQFCTLIEHVIWRAFSIACIIVPSAMVAITVLGERVQMDINKPLTTLGVAYFLVRSFLLVEILVALRCVPPATYVDINWGHYIPHLQ